MKKYLMILLVSILLSGCVDQKSNRDFVGKSGDDLYDAIEIYTENSDLIDVILVHRVTGGDFKRFLEFHDLSSELECGSDADIMLVYGVDASDNIQLLFVPYNDDFPVSKTYVLTSGITYSELINYLDMYFSGNYDLEDSSTAILSLDSLESNTDIASQVVSPIELTFVTNNGSNVFVYFTVDGIMHLEN